MTNTRTCTKAMYYSNNQCFQWFFDICCKNAQLRTSSVAICCTRNSTLFESVDLHKGSEDGGSVRIPLGNELRTLRAWRASGSTMLGSRRRRSISDDGVGHLASTQARCGGAVRTGWGWALARCCKLKPDMGNVLFPPQKSYPSRAHPGRRLLLGCFRISTVPLLLFVTAAHAQTTNFVLGTTNLLVVAWLNSVVSGVTPSTGRVDPHSERLLAVLGAILPKR